MGGAAAAEAEEEECSRPNGTAAAETEEEECSRPKGTCDTLCTFLMVRCNLCTSLVSDHRSMLSAVPLILFMPSKNSALVTTPSPPSSPFIMSKTLSASE